MKSTSLFRIINAHRSIAETRPMSEINLCDWVALAKTGAGIVYYMGHLAFDRCPSARVHSESVRKNLTALAKRALQLEEDRLICLCQHRFDNDRFAYVAIKCNPRPRLPLFQRQVLVPHFTCLEAA